MWTLYIVTDTGRKVPHWTDSTRARCRAMKPRDLPAGVRAVIERASLCAKESR